MKIPYGISNFKAIREEEYWYIDKTRYIDTLENSSGKYAFFIRPRRFGKSLFVSMLRHYYDINERDSFEALFGDLHIGRRPTPNRNRYLILELDFSGLNTSGKTELQASFTRVFRHAIIRLIDEYAAFFPNGGELKHEIERHDELRELWDLLFAAVRPTGKKIYLLVDEYDHFANDIIAMGDSDLYRGIVRAAGFVRDFYEAVKIGTKDVIDRLFITGVSPIMLDDLTSGFNIADNLTTSPALNAMLGFTDEEVHRIADSEGLGMDRAALMEELRKNYNGYLFHEDGGARIYNPDMILYFFKQWKMTGKYPKQLVDDNVKTDYGRLQRLISNEQNRETLEEIIREEQIVANLVNKFSFDLMYDSKHFVSLLFYMGLLTIERQEHTRLLLRIPNYVIKTMYWEYIGERLSRLHGIAPDVGQLGLAVESMAYEGKAKPFIDFICRHVLKPLSNRDMTAFTEKHIKLILFAYLSMNRAYRPISERENENGYTDIFLERDPRFPDLPYEWLIELKYLKKADARELASIKEEGLRQLNRYASSRDLIGKPGIKQVLVVFIGKDESIVIEL